VFFVVAKTMYKNSSGTKFTANSPLEEVAAATSSYVSEQNNKKKEGIK